MAPASSSCVKTSTQTAPASMGDAEPFSADLMVAITSLKETLTTKIDTVTTEVNLIRHEMYKFRSRLSEVESRIPQVEDTVHTDSRELKILQKEVQSLHDKTVDMENSLRRNDLRVLGLPSKAKGPKPVEFAEGFPCHAARPHGSPTYICSGAGSHGPHYAIYTRSSIQTLCAKATQLLGQVASGHQEHTQAIL